MYNNSFFLFLKYLTMRKYRINPIVEIRPRQAKRARPSAIFIFIIPAQFEREFQTTRKRRTPDALREIRVPRRSRFPVEKDHIPGKG